MNCNLWRIWDLKTNMYWSARNATLFQECSWLIREHVTQVWLWQPVFKLSDHLGSSFIGPRLLFGLVITKAWVLSIKHNLHEYGLVKFICVFVFASVYVYLDWLEAMGRARLWTSREIKPRLEHGGHSLWVQRTYNLFLGQDCIYFCICICIWICIYIAFSLQQICICAAPSCTMRSSS